MTSEVGMHLYFTVCPPQDDFAPGNASPFNEISSKGCIDDKNRDKINRRIISGREFLSAGMKSAGKNHLWKRFFIRRDEISEGKSSLGEDFYPQR